MLKVENINKYFGGLKAVNNVSLEVKRVMVPIRWKGPVETRPRSGSAGATTLQVLLLLVLLLTT